jgi:hypothetical protein
MSARTQALKDIQDYLTPKAVADKQRRRLESARWLPYANTYTYDSLPEDNFELRLSHITDPNINLVKLSK